jgi:hypothetical protein
MCWGMLQGVCEHRLTGLVPEAAQVQVSKAESLSHAVQAACCCLKGCSLLLPATEGVLYCICMVLHWLACFLHQLCCHVISSCWQEQPFLPCSAVPMLPAVQAFALNLQGRASYCLSPCMMIHAALRPAFAGSLSCVQTVVQQVLVALTS